ncbi:hypothetical protein AG1IA_04921 [Rhizoctonia solani AG-1 IA]|uniref:Uncharacterized protein n=1 Tax=Thanatephorus cucumeris (strain AG1-IA) TaxID=983506 RepID=L8WXG3_THACA|nr:hypothetical protein AG1IA_04921 [Rhizoctonia solani AG-1 IA]
MMFNQRRRHYAPGPAPDYNPEHCCPSHKYPHNHRGYERQGNCQWNANKTDRLGTGKRSKGETSGSERTDNVSPFASGYTGASLTSTSLDPMTRSDAAMFDEVRKATFIPLRLTRPPPGRTHVR